MVTRPYCVYNKTNESFLSLGVTLGGYGPWMRQLARKASNAGNEGRWITTLGGIRTLGLLRSRDLIYLDHAHTVISTVEGLSSVRLAPLRSGTVSILELPVRSVASSQTSVGHQFVICAAEEMEFRLRSMPHAESVGATSQDKGWHSSRRVESRRATRRVRWPSLVAYGSEVDGASVHGVRDISASGLYLLTGERWPVGAHIRMTLQRDDGLDDTSVPIVVDLRVARWGSDGMGLEFVQSDVEQVALVAMHVR